MLNTKRAAAYHEVGHFCRAIAAHENAVVGTIVQPDEHGWGGETPVNKQLVPGGESHLCCIALAGFLAEAKGVAGDGITSPPIAFNAQLLADVQQILGEPYHNTLDDAWVVQVPLAAGGTSPGTLTRPDIDEIPPPERAAAHLEQALLNTIEFLNAKQSVVDVLAGYVESKGDLQNGPFLQWMIRKP